MGVFRKINLHRQNAEQAILSSHGFKVFITLVILVDIVASVLYNVPQFDEFAFYLRFIPYFAAAIFAVEYLVRIDSAPIAFYPKRAFKARLKYVFSFFGIIDFISIVPFVVPTFLGSNDAELIALFDLSRIFLVFKFVRHSRSFREILLVFMIIRRELWATVFFIIVILIFCSALMVYIEVDTQPEAFAGLGEGIWWGINTITAVGYGDVYPISLWGRVVGSVTAFIGVLLFALPTALISSAFIKYYTQKDKKID